MGTTSDKLVYLNSTKAAIKAAINALPNGPYIEDGATFRSYEHAVEAVGVGCMVAATDEAAWYILSPSNMYTDRAGTIPVTALDDFVGYISDSSGNANDLVAVSDAGRALYKTDGTYGWIQLDNVDDNYSTTFANPIVGTMLIGTRKGTIHLEVDIPAGAWSLTPNAAYFPGNTITDIILKDGVMTDAELANAKAWLASRGSPVVYTPTGTDLANAFRWDFISNVYFSEMDTSSVTSMYSVVRGANTKILSLDISQNDFTNTTSFLSFANAVSNLDELVVGDALLSTSCTNYTTWLTNTSLTQASIDSVLVAVAASYAANGLTGGTFDQSGGSTPSATGNAAIDALRAAGMTVTVTGGY